MVGPTIIGGLSKIAVRETDYYKVNCFQNVSFIINSKIRRPSSKLPIFLLSISPHRTLSTLLIVAADTGSVSHMKLQMSYGGSHHNFPDAPW